MKSLLKRTLLGTIVGLLILLAPSVMLAVPLFNITPAPLVRPMFAGTSSQTFVEYQVQNTSGRALTGVSYRLGPNAFLDTADLTTCGSTLAAGVTCIVALVYKAPGTKAQGVGEASVPLTICVNGRSCEGPTSGNTVKLRVVPALKKVYIINSATTVAAVDTRTDTVASTITLPAGTANGVALKPDLTRLYVSSTGPSAIYVVNTTNNTLVATITPTLNPSSLAISPDGARLYVSEAGATVNNVINTATNAITTPTITWPGVSAVNIAISPNGNRLFSLDGASGAVYSANTLTGAVATITTLGGSDDRIGASPTGQFVYVTQPNTSSVVDKVNLATGAVTALTTGLPTNSNTLTTTSVDGRLLYVANNTGVVGVVDTITDSLVSTLATGGAATLPQFTPDQTRLYLLNSGGTVDILKDNVLVGTATVGALTLDNSVAPFIG